jgi:CheY-like chemotaxis protein
MIEKKRILIVDDERDIVKLIEIALTKHGYDTITASNGQDAIDLSRDKKPDLILMDISLKGQMDGIETAKQIHFSSDVPVIYLTAYADDERLAKVKETQPYGYILKPFEDRELKAAIEICLYKAEAERQLKTLTEELRISTASFQNIVGKNIDGIVVVNRNKIVKFLNFAAEAMFGLKTEQVIGKEFTFPVTVGEVTEVEITRSSGNRGIGEILTVETQWGAKPAYLVSIRDITDRKKMENELKKHKHEPETFHTVTVGSGSGLMDIKKQTAENENKRC